MIDAVVTRKDWGVELLTVYQLHDRGTDSSDREQQFGLLRAGWHPQAGLRDRPRRNAAVPRLNPASLA